MGNYWNMTETKRCRNINASALAVAIEAIWEGNAHDAGRSIMPAQERCVRSFDNNYFELIRPCCARG